jgi:Domain of unknown function (DUF6285)
MQDRPTATELAEAVRSFLEEEVGPALQDARSRFRALVAANALAILGRDLALGPELLREEVELLGGLLGMRGDALALNAELCRRIRLGHPPRGTLEALRHIAELKLRIASPRYLESPP